MAFDPWLRVVIGFALAWSILMAEALNFRGGETPPTPRHLQLGDVDKDIFGGRNTDPNEYPFYAQKYWKGGFVGCAASLIASKWILTAAHCVDSDEQFGGVSNGFLEWRVGSYCRSGSDSGPNCGARETWAKATQILVHPEWDRPQLLWDYALVELNRTIDEKPVTIDDGSTYNKLKNDDRIQNIGMGYVNTNFELPEILQEAVNFFIEPTACRKTFANALDPSIMCTIGHDASTCQGDSGSVAMVADASTPTGWIQVGTVSFGLRDGCRPHEYPEAYARTATAYSWIVDNVCPSYAGADAADIPEFCAGIAQLSVAPTVAPTATPSHGPSDKPTTVPTREPSHGPTDEPTTGPTNTPTDDPTRHPTKKPTQGPTYEPTREPTYKPTREPTYKPTQGPTSSPTREPTLSPTQKPTHEPSQKPSRDPVGKPTAEPTGGPTKEPTPDPTAEPSNDPTTGPTHIPSTEPTSSSSKRPTTYSPSSEPRSDQPIASTDITGNSGTPEPTLSPIASDTTLSSEPTSNPSTRPFATQHPTLPTFAPSNPHTFNPTVNPTATSSTPPTTLPTFAPTSNTTLSPTNKSSDATKAPTPSRDSVRPPSGLKLEIPGSEGGGDGSEGKSDEKIANPAVGENCSKRKKNGKKRKKKKKRKKRCRKKGDDSEVDSDTENGETQEDVMKNKNNSTTDVENKDDSITVDPGDGERQGEGRNKTKIGKDDEEEEEPPGDERSRGKTNRKPREDCEEPSDANFEFGGDVIDCKFLTSRTGNKRFYCARQSAKKNCPVTCKVCKP